MTRRHLTAGRRRALTVVLVGAVGLAGCARPSAETAAAPGASTAGSSTAGSSTAGSSTAGSSTAGSTTTAVGDPAVPLGECAAGAAATRTPGVLTVATGVDRVAPWFVGDPAAGQGLEAAVALAVAQGLGVTATRWVEADRAVALAGRTEAFDLDLDRFSADELAAAPVDASSGYFPDADAVLVLADQPAAATLIGVSALRLVEVPGADGSTVAERDDGVLVTRGAVPDPAAAAAALRSGSADGVVLPVTDALTLAAGDPRLRVLGQVPTGSSQPDQLVALLAVDSALTPCVSAVLDRLRVEGTLEQVARTWVPVPVLE